VGNRLRFADGTAATVFRETVVTGAPLAAPAVLAATFRLRGIRGRAGHTLLRLESILNTPLFVGFPGFVSKLWFSHDATGAYRGIYQWDGPERTEVYARALWRILALVGVTGSVRYDIVAGMARDQFGRGLVTNDDVAPAEWWQPVPAGGAD
jgi:hypothetical protein